MTIRHLLGHNPISFNDLLDLFEAYAETISPPLEKGINLIREQFDYSQGDIFSHICSVSHVSGNMIKDIKRIRADRNRGSDVTITWPSGTAMMLSHAIKETSRVIEDAATVFGFLQSRAEEKDTVEDFEATAIISLAHRALEHAEEQVCELRQFAIKISKASKYLDVEEEVPS